MSFAGRVSTLRSLRSIVRDLRAAVQVQRMRTSFYPEREALDILEHLSKKLHFALKNLLGVHHRCWAGRFGLAQIFRYLL